MTTAQQNPGSYIGIDPGRTMGWGACQTGGGEFRHGTWKFTASEEGAAFSAYAADLRALIGAYPDPLVGIELLTIVTHEDDRGNPRVDAKTVAFQSGWLCVTQTVCYAMGVRPPVSVPIQSWRSKTHGVVQKPRNVTMTDGEKARFFKSAAMAYCEASGWDVASADEAEGCCIMDYLRILHEPGYAFDKGHSGHHQENLFG